MLDRFWALVFTFALATSPALAHDASHPRAPAPLKDEVGTPGKASDVVATVTITMAEFDGGRMGFDPATIPFRPGTTLRLVLMNNGLADHELVLGTAKQLAEHAAMMREMPGMAHDEPNALRLKPGETREFIWKFGNSADIEFACLVPGHIEAGMRGRFDRK